MNDDWEGRRYPPLREPLPEGVTIAHGMARAIPDPDCFTLSCTACGGGPFFDHVFYGWFDITGVAAGLWARKHDHGLPAGLGGGQTKEDGADE